MSLTILQSEKMPFQAIKTKSSNSRKIYIFPKGLTHGFGPKMAIFPSYFFQAITARKNFFQDILEGKTTFLGYKNKNFKQSKNLHFSKGVNPWLLSKNRRFGNFFFQAIQARKMSFTIFQNEKTLFQAIKTRSSKSRKIDIFPKGLTYGFGTKMATFPNFLFWQNRPGKCL